MRRVAILIAVGLTIAACSDGAKKEAPAPPPGRILFVSDRGSATAGCAFLGGDGCQSDIYVVHADGSNLARLSDAPGTDGRGGAVWSPDGSKIAYVHEAPGEGCGPLRAEVIVLKADGSDRKSLGAWGCEPFGPGAAPQWSPDGSEVAFAGTDGFVIAKGDGSGRRVFTSRLQTHPGPGVPLVGGPFWSRDGKRVALAYDEALFVSDPDGKNRVALDRPLKNHIPEWVWSPDGTLIAFTKASGTYVAHADGSAVTRVLQKAANLEAAPGGMTWASGRPVVVLEGDLISVNPDGTDVRSITTGPENDLFPVASPTGSKILFIRARSDENGELAEETLYVVNSDGSGLRMLVAPKVGSASWSPVPPP